MKKTILDSESIDAGNGTTMRVRDLIRHVLTVDVRFNNGWEGISVAQRIEAACAARDGQGDLGIDEGDYQKLVDAVRNPSTLTGFFSYPVAPAFKAAPLCQAIFNATNEEPPK